MPMKLLHFCVLVILNQMGTNGVRLKTDKRVLNVCMDGRHHYDQPVTTKLFGVCKPWESKSCCSNDTAFHLQKPVPPLYNFNLAHCQKWTAKCLRRFYMSNCFYECSSNVGPWLRRDRSSIRNERFFQVPFCQSDCNAWWDDCKDQLTCVDDFSSFDWINGTNHCPSGSNCTTFQSRFHNATYFCEHIYPDDYKVVNDSAPCLKFDAQASGNAKVAEYYAKLKGLYNPDVDDQSKDVVTSTSKPSSSSGSTTLTSPSGYSSGTVIALVLVIVVLVAILTGICAYKFRDAIQTSKRAGTSYLPSCSWFSKAKTSAHSIVHHQALDDDRRFLQNDDNDDDEDLNPHGALEIDL